MADPTPYEKQYSFSGFQANNPSQPLPAPRVDDELFNIEAAISGTVLAIRDVRRSDGQLVNGIVTLDSLSAEVRGFTGVDSLRAPNNLSDLTDPAAARDNLGLTSTATSDPAKFASDIRGLPTGGSTGQVLAKTSSGPYSVGWTSAGAGDVLRANNLSDLPNPAAARTNLGLAAPIVATRTALKTLDTATIKTALLTEPGHEGLFVWEAGDMASRVATDATALWYVTKTGQNGSAGAWRRIGRRSERAGLVADAAGYALGSSGVRPGLWTAGGYPYDDYEITRGDLLVLPAKGAYGSDYDGMMPNFWVRTDKRGNPDVGVQQKPWDLGTPRFMAREGGNFIGRDDTPELAFAQFWTTDENSETGTIIDYLNAPGAPGSAGRISSQVWKAYTIRYVAAASTVNHDISTLKGGDSIGGRTVATGRRVLLRAQGNSAENGVYLLGATNGSTARDTNFNSWGNHVGGLVQVASTVGGANAGSVFRTRNVPGGTLGTTSIVWDNVGAQAYTAPDTDASATLFGYYHPWIGGNGKAVQLDLRVADFYSGGQLVVSLGIPDNTGDAVAAGRFAWPATNGTWPWSNDNTTLRLSMPNAAGTALQERTVRAASAAASALVYSLSSGGISIPASSTYYVGAGAASTAITGTAPVVVTRAGTLSNVRLRTSGSIGSTTETWTVTLFKNNVATGVTFTMTGNVSTGNSGAQTLSVAVDDGITAQITSSAGTTSRVTGLSFEVAGAAGGRTLFIDDAS